MISLTSTNHGEKRKISAKRSRQKRWAGVTHFVIQAAVTGVSMTGFIKLGTRAWYTWRVYLRDRSKRRRGCEVLRFPQGFPQRRRAVAAPDKAGGQGGARKACLWTEVVLKSPDAWRGESGCPNLSRCGPRSASASRVAQQPVSQET